MTVQAVDNLYAQMPIVQCKGLCVECCSPVGHLMSDFEFKRILARTGKKPNGAKEMRAGKVCNMLKDGKCTVYDIRPVICRLWGADAQMPCSFGCTGSNVLPAGSGKVFIKAINRLTE